MNRFDDERIRFYLRHRARIQEWAAIREEANAALNGWLRDLEDQIRQQFAASDAAIRAVVEDLQKWPGFRLTRGSWNLGDEREICISLEWSRAKVIDDAPYVGLRAPAGGAIADALRARESLRQTRSRLRHKTSSWCPLCQGSCRTVAAG